MIRCSESLTSANVYRTKRRYRFWCDECYELMLVMAGSKAEAWQKFNNKRAKIRRQAGLPEVKRELA